MPQNKGFYLFLSTLYLAIFLGVAALLVVGLSFIVTWFLPLSFETVFAGFSLILVLAAYWKRKDWQKWTR